MAEDYLLFYLIFFSFLPFLPSLVLVGFGFFFFFFLSPCSAFVLGRSEEQRLKGGKGKKEVCRGCYKLKGIWIYSERLVHSLAAFVRLPFFS